MAFCPRLWYAEGEVMHMKRLLALLLLCCLLPLGAWAEEKAYEYTDRLLLAAYDSDTLKYEIHLVRLNDTTCYLTRLWLADPARQIKKVISPWHMDLARAEDLAAQVEGAALVINGSGYVSPNYPAIPETYPGTSMDYYYTPLGSLAVVDGQVLRNLEGVPYYGLTLEEDGLHLYVGADNGEVLAHQPLQTWSFYEGCPMAQDGADILDHDWYFANRRAIRTILAKLREENTYLILTATDTFGLTLVEANDFLLGEFAPEWVYDLDGGPSTALFYRHREEQALRLLYGAGQRIVDVMGFVE